MSAAVVAGTLTLGAARTEAAPLGFSCVTSNAASSCAIAHSQLSAALTDLGNGSVEFLFQTTGTGASSITQIYFDQPNPALLSLQSQTASTGVGFQSASGSTGLQLGAAGGGLPQSGINPGQWLRLVFALNQGSTVASMLTSLATGDLRIGTHVRAIGAVGSSETFVNTPAAVVPEPASLMLPSTGLAGAAVARRRCRRAEA